jgi:hypothetical protein
VIEQLVPLNTPTNAAEIFGVSQFVAFAETY